MKLSELGNQVGRVRSLRQFRPDPCCATSHAVPTAAGRTMWHHLVHDPPPHTPYL